MLEDCILNRCHPGRQAGQGLPFRWDRFSDDGQPRTGRDGDRGGSELAKPAVVIGPALRHHPDTHGEHREARQRHDKGPGARQVQPRRGEHHER